ncbi:hypothetical protein ACTVKR_23890, partial [Serratia bockelmannii]
MADNNIDVATLKNIFKEGATPNQKDYAQLIDLAAVGSKALGAKDDDTTHPTPGVGLTFDEGMLSVKPGLGVKVDGEGVAVNVDDKAKAVTTMTATTKGLAIAIAKDKGLGTSDKGLCIRTGQGLKVGTSGLEIDCADNGGLSTQGGVLRVVLGDKSVLCLDNDNKLSIKLNKKTPNYIESTNEGLAITQDGIQAIKNAFKKMSSGALNEAVLGTKNGSTEIKNTVDTPLVKAISQELHSAYTKGYQKRCTEKLAVTQTSPVKIFVISGEPVDLATLAQVTQGKTVYFIPGSTKKDRWDKKIVAGLDPNGTLHLTGNAGGEISVLAVVASYVNGLPDIATTVVTVIVDNPPDFTKSTMAVSPETCTVSEEVTVTVTLKDYNEKLLAGYKEFIEKTVIVPNCDKGQWIYDEKKGSYVGTYTTTQVSGNDSKAKLVFSYPEPKTIESKIFTIKQKIPVITNLKIVSSHGDEYKNGAIVPIGETLCANCSATGQLDYQWQYQMPGQSEWKNPGNSDKRWGKAEKFKPSKDYGTEGDKVRVTVTASIGDRHTQATSDYVIMNGPPEVKGLKLNKTGS